MNFKCIIVLYNVNYKDAVSYGDLIETDCYKQGKMEIICVDNSVKDFANETLSSLKNHHYINMHGNKGLPKAYNAAIGYLSKKKGDGESVVVLLDDDTHIGNEYFAKMSQAMDSSCDIYLPIIMDEKGILSPGIMKHRQCRRCFRLEEINQQNVCGINSGMAIRSHVFKDYRYNEEMFLDYVDHYFLRDMKRLGRKLKIVDTTLRQNFSSMTDSYEQTLRRFQIFKKDIKIFYSGNFIEKMVYFYVISRRRIGILLKFKNLSILWKS